MAAYPGLGVEVWLLPGTGTPLPALAQITVSATSAPCQLCLLLACCLSWMLLPTASHLVISAAWQLSA